MSETLKTIRVNRESLLNMLYLGETKLSDRDNLILQHAEKLANDNQLQLLVRNLMKYMAEIYPKIDTNAFNNLLDIIDNIEIENDNGKFEKVGSWMSAVSRVAAVNAVVLELKENAFSGMDS